MIFAPVVSFLYFSTDLYWTRCDYIRVSPCIVCSSKLLPLLLLCCTKPFAVQRCGVWNMRLETRRWCSSPPSKKLSCCLIKAIKQMAFYFSGAMFAFQVFCFFSKELYVYNHEKLKCHCDHAMSLGPAGGAKVII